MIELLQQQLNKYKATGPIEEERATREIFQEVALYALWRADFFEVAAFQAGPVCGYCMAYHVFPRT